MRFLHTMIRVKNLQNSINFYTNVMEMKLLRQKHHPHGKFTLAFLGYDTEESSTVLELTHNWEEQDYVMGTYYGHVAISIDNIDEFVAAKHHKLAKYQARVSLEPKIMQGTNTKLAFIEDPDGYKIELLERQ